MTYSPILIVHICTGIIAVLSGGTALLVRKGSPLHRTTGRVFAISMLVMSSSGAYMAFVKSQSGNVFGGVITFYLVATAWLTIIRRGKETRLVEFALLLVALAAGTIGLILGWNVAHSATGVKDGNPAAAYFVFAIVALLSASGDVRMLIRGGIAGTQRLVRHLWRMCFALLIATASFFLGTASDPAVGRTGLRARLFTDAVRATHLPELPVIAVVVLTVFWLCRVWFADVYRRTNHQVRASP